MPPVVPKLRVSLAALHTAAQTRKPGYLEACQKLGKLTPSGTHLLFTEEDYTQLSQAFNPTPIGLGDLIHKVAAPIGRAIHWPCLKGDGTTDLKPESPCAKLRTLANKIPISLRRRRKSIISPPSRN